ncbi:bifunctional [glutamate--ammonia ligase]-adenylyl-L-tyrosine phosphorylase/[glutamate--ammonia-ligase] adenylyltransferase [Aliikangiella sp. G2MR2-5]|uniref:bifunctional [glutamate--ammonia ligase]-adenylyl-L-tyrosine phosphorylase/[glutamate--ammonia-ligase] adenylyltransferase n=1 Tax=Aliikangiella sp. G2MR2-5 TaxID=2788943 RepID=UPI0018AC7EC0|nr:bifunctional [glutamate--ammonia ligase]-adenylyl-L-tyrosine phosphorylase/[glutamate--ammonia-ligase] adenylyltransferase [Aliikangiella sp. G2MR2-5]
MFTQISEPNHSQELANDFFKTSLPSDLFQNWVSVSSASTFVCQVFTRFPEYCCKLLLWHLSIEDDDFEKALNIELTEFEQKKGSETEQEIMCSLRIFRKCHSAVLAFLELSGKFAIDTSCLRISLLAEVLIQNAADKARLILAPRFGIPFDSQGNQQHLLVLAMGKLGGRELNFSSDIDLIFFYTEEGTTQKGSRSIENSQYFKKLAVLLIRLLDENNEEGFVFRVDMRLRPYGDSGALVITLAQAEDYYQEQGREWERYAMVRAKVITGSLKEREKLESIIHPFCFRRYIDYGVIDSIREMKAMIQRESRRKGLKDNIKLGEGGIREVEFIVQSLQLIQGGRDKRLTERSILKVLPFLVEAKMLPEETADFLAQAYRFLRRLEHCIQELHEKQTHQLPQLSVEQQYIAQVMGFASWSEFLTKLLKVQSSVHQEFEHLLGQERQKEHLQSEFFQSLAEGHIDAEQLVKKAEEEGFTQLDTEQSQLFIKNLNSFLQMPSVKSLSARGSDRLKTFFPSLLSTCLASEFPQDTLKRTLTIIQSVLKRTAYLELLSENPPILQHLVDLAGKSEWIVQRLSAFPILFDELLYPNSLYEPLQTADLESELRQSLLRVDTLDEEEVLDVLRVFKQTNELRVAAALLAERLSISQVSRYLTQLAQVVLDAAIRLCWQLVTQRHGKPEGLSDGDYGFAVIGYGKLGGMELGFGSDLDLVFLFNQPVDENTIGKRPLNNSRFYTRLAQKLIHLLSTRTNLGLLYEVDMRLRPSGSSGLLVSHIDAYRDYQMESAWTWEHQALVRARFVAGDEKLAPLFEKVRDKTLKKKRDTVTLKKDVTEMRDKMRSELEVTRQDKIDLKQTRGGLVDIEFIAQYVALSYRGQLSVPHNTVDCLLLAKDEGIIDKNQALQLIRTYRQFRNHLNELAITKSEKLVEREEFEDKTLQIAAIWKGIFGKSQDNI